MGSGPTCPVKRMRSVIATGGDGIRFFNNPPQMDPLEDETRVFHAHKMQTTKEA